MSGITRLFSRSDSVVAKVEEANHNNEVNHVLECLENRSRGGTLYFKWDFKIPTKPHLKVIHLDGVSSFFLGRLYGFCGYEKCEQWKGVDHATMASIQAYDNHLAAKVAALVIQCLRLNDQQKLRLNDQQTARLTGALLALEFRYFKETEKNEWKSEWKHFFSDDRKAPNLEKMLNQIQRIQTQVEKQKCDVVLTMDQNGIFESPMWFAFQKLAEQKEKLGSLLNKNDQQISALALEARKAQENPYAGCQWGLC